MGRPVLMPQVLALKRNIFYYSYDGPNIAGVVRAAGSLSGGGCRAAAVRKITPARTWAATTSISNRKATGCGSIWNWNWSPASTRPRRGLLRFRLRVPLTRIVAVQRRSCSGSSRRRWSKSLSHRRAAFAGPAPDYVNESTSKVANRPLVCGYPDGGVLRPEEKLPPATTTRRCWPSGTCPTGAAGEAPRCRCPACWRPCMARR